MATTRIENVFVKVIFGWGVLAAMFTSVPMNVNVFVGANSNDLTPGGSSTVGEVNISAILNSFQMGYDKRVRPNYGGKFVVVLIKQSYLKTLGLFHEKIQVQKI